MSFAEDVMPIFRGRCVGCHQPGGEGFAKSGLDLCLLQMIAGPRAPTTA